jgi:hypothetical protein
MNTKRNDTSRSPSPSPSPLLPKKQTTPAKQADGRLKMKNHK